MSLDLERALRFADGDRAVLAEICRAFITSFPIDLERLDQAARSGDVAAFTFAIHKLRSSIAVFNGGSLLAAVAEIERGVTREQTPLAFGAFADVRDELQSLLAAVRSTASTFT